jgi:GNAT superfamily N-acetyltransferase
MADEVLDRRSQAEQEARWTRILQQPQRSGTVVAEEAGEILGFSSFGPELGTDRRYQGELYAIYLLERHQRKGIGRRLVTATAQGLLERHLPNMLLWVLSTNPARLFYERMGGTYLRDRNVEFNGALLHELAYGWTDLQPLLDGG